MGGREGLEGIEPTKEKKTINIEIGGVPRMDYGHRRAS